MTDVGRIEFGPPLTTKEARDMALNAMRDAEARRLESAKKEAERNKCPDCAALEAELAAWRECGEELEWCIYDTDKKEGFIRICPMCHGKYDKHREGCKLAARMGRK